MFAPPGADKELEGGNVESASVGDSTKYSIQNPGESMTLDVFEGLGDTAMTEAGDTRDTSGAAPPTSEKQSTTGKDDFMAETEDNGDTGSKAPATSKKQAIAPATSSSTHTNLQDYSNEARAYMARYEYLSEAHDLGEYEECREGCLDLLSEPRIPR